MKTSLVTAAALSLFVAQQVWAHHDSSPECKKIHDACAAANIKDKDMHKKCFGPLMAGKTVANVDVSSDDVTACKHAMKGKGHHKKDADQKDQPAQAPSTEAPATQQPGQSDNPSVPDQPGNPPGQ